MINWLSNWFFEFECSGALLVGLKGHLTCTRLVTPCNAELLLCCSNIEKIFYLRQWTCFGQDYWCSSWNIMIKNIKKVFCKTPSLQIRSNNVVYKTNLVFETLQRCIIEIQRVWFEPFWCEISTLGVPMGWISRIFLFLIFQRKYI